MRGRIAALLGLLLVAAAPAWGQAGFGIGIIVGEPTGLSIKQWLGGGHAFDAAAAWSFSGTDTVQLHADYLMHRFDLVRIPTASGRVPLYAGLGGRLRFRSDDGPDDDEVTLGLRVPFGIAYLLASAPVDFFAEVVPVLDLIPDTDFDVNAAIGARFYFQ